MESLYLALFGRTVREEMNYNIDTTIKLSGQLFIRRPAFKKLYNKHIDYLNISQKITFLLKTPFDEVRCKNQSLLEIRCSGTLSGSFYKNALPDILKHTTGEAEYVFIWEGGDSITGLHIKDGVVTEKGVKLSLE